MLGVLEILIVIAGMNTRVPLQYSSNVSYFPEKTQLFLFIIIVRWLRHAHNDGYVRGARRYDWESKSKDTQEVRHVPSR